MDACKDAIFFFIAAPQEIANASANAYARKAIFCIYINLPSSLGAASNSDCCLDFGASSPASSSAKV